MLSGHVKTRTRLMQQTVNMCKPCWLDTCKCTNIYSLADVYSMFWLYFIFNICCFYNTNIKYQQILGQYAVGILCIPVKSCMIVLMYMYFSNALYSLNKIHATTDDMSITGTAVETQDNQYMHAHIKCTVERGRSIMISDLCNTWIQNNWLKTAKEILATKIYICLEHIPFCIFVLIHVYFLSLS